MAFLLGAAACSSNNEAKDVKPLPVIDFKAPSGGYTIHTSQWLRIAPEVKHAEGATYVWTLDKDTVSLERDLRHVFAAAGETTFQLKVKTAAGETTQSVKVVVNARLIPTASSKCTISSQLLPSSPTNCPSGQKATPKRP